MSNRWRKGLVGFFADVLVIAWDAVMSGEARREMRQARQNVSARRRYRCSVARGRRNTPPFAGSAGMRYAAVLVLLGLLQMATGCATYITHQQVLASLEREALRNYARGLGPVCAVDGERIPVADMGWWDVVCADKIAHFKGVVSDIIIGTVGYTGYRQGWFSSGGDDPDSVTYYITNEAAADTAGADAATE